MVGKYMHTHFSYEVASIIIIKLTISITVPYKHLFLFPSIIIVVWSVKIQ